MQLKFCCFAVNYKPQPGNSSVGVYKSRCFSGNQMRYSRNILEGVFRGRSSISARVMRTADFNATRVRNRICRIRHSLRFTPSTAPISYYLRLLRKLRENKQNLRLLRVRSILISSITFNLNSYSDEQCLTDFRFRRCELLLISEIVGWVGGKTKRNGYVCDTITATCLLTRRLSSPCRWADLETKFGMHTSAMSEIF